MAYELKYEGLSPDEPMEERLLLQCRRVVVETDAESQVSFLVRLIDGKVQVRAEILFSGRRLSVVVWRSDAEAALRAAVDAALDAVDFKNIGKMVATRPSTPVPQLSTLQ